jgi:hypothetical protein
MDGGFWPGGGHSRPSLSIAICKLLPTDTSQAVRTLDHRQRRDPNPRGLEDPALQTFQKICIGLEVFSGPQPSVPGHCGLGRTESRCSLASALVVARSGEETQPVFLIAAPPQQVSSVLPGSPPAPGNPRRVLLDREIRGGERCCLVRRATIASPQPTHGGNNMGKTTVAI